MPSSPRWLLGSKLKQVPTDELVSAIAPTPQAVEKMSERILRCLKCYFEISAAKKDRADALESMLKALADMPLWVINTACDRWERQQRRRPSPADLRNTCLRIVEPISYELDQRRKWAERDAEEARELEKHRADPGVIQQITDDFLRSVGGPRHG